MSDHSARTHSPRRSVKLLLEELEWRNVPSLVGLQLDLPLSGILPSVTVSMGSGGSSAPGTTSAPGITTTTSNLSATTITFTPNAQSTGPTSWTITIVPVTVAQQPSSTSSESGAAASTASILSANSSTVHEGFSQGSANSFVFPTAFAPALGIQAAPTGSSTILGGSASGINFELLGNLPSLLGPGNVMQGTTNTSLSAVQLTGAPYGGAAFGRLDLYMDRTMGSAAAFGLTHTPSEQREESLPENPPTPPDDTWWISAPQANEPILPPCAILLREQLDLPPCDVPFSGERSLPVESQAFDALSNGAPPGFLLDEENAVMPDDEEQSPEQSGIPPAAAILSCAAGAFWAPRFRSFRRKSAVKSLKDGNV